MLVLSLNSVNYPTSFDVVRGNFDPHSVAGKDFYVIFSHFSGKIAKHYFLGIVEFYAKQRIRKVLYNLTFYDYDVFILHKSLILTHTQVKINAFLLFTAIVCSNCAEMLPSAVTIDHLLPLSCFISPVVWA